MNTTNHTSGDWYVERIPKMMDKRLDKWDIWAVYSTRKTRLWDKPQPICNFNWGIPEGKANAHLIAGAPDLLSALRFLLADYVAIEGEKLTGSSVPADMARAAIAKAEGVK
jgi:hypothetical protein